MTNDDSNTTTSEKRFRGPELTSALALAVSIFALAIGAWQTRLMQSQARASVWPHLEIGYTYNSNVDENAFLWRIDNNGVGPARIETIALTFDGEAGADMEAGMAWRSPDFTARRLQSSSWNALVKKSAAPKLPDFSAM
jgi:hypothetical protein